ncbi:MAG: hypothetical protein ABSA02_03025 [Trebonia sp.]
MEQAELASIRELFDREVHERFPGAPIKRIEVLNYGDEPEVEPGQLVARIVVEAPADPPERMRAFETFHNERREAIHELRRELDKLPIPVLLQVVAGGEQPTAGGITGPRIQLLRGGPGPCGPGPDGPGQTPVMARLGQEDVATLDTLITAGIASSRAEAVRWALARIRERPAFEQLRVHTREIENLKAQF